jgi:hypothetical protein
MANSSEGNIFDHWYERNDGAILETVVELELFY